jgi:hypothetical protein
MTTRYHLFDDSLGSRWWEMVSAKLKLKVDTRYLKCFFLKGELILEIIF